MISYLSGTIQFKGLNYIIVMTSGGVGYKVFTTSDLISQSNIDKALNIYTYTHIKDDALDLYGLPTLEDLNLFEMLLSVSGIGPKTALAIFGNGKIAKIKEAIVKGDVDFFAGVPRLGRKNSQKIIIELRSKLGKLGDIDLASESPETKEIVEALKTFGFNSAEAREAIKSIKDIKGSTSEKIREALRFLGKNNY